MGSAARSKRPWACALAPAAACVLALAGCGNATKAPAPAATGSRTVPADPPSVIAVSPLPGTPDASAVTQVSFLGGAGTRVADVSVVGAVTGRHDGRLRAYSTGSGQSFVPSAPFAPGEQVNVSARVLSGSGRGHSVHTWFTVATQAPVAQKRWPLNTGDPTAIQHYVSAPSLTPSTVRINTPAQPGAASGDLMLTPYQGPGTPGPMISDQAGRLVWFDPLSAEDAASNLSVQSWQGRPALVWWQGRVLELGFGQGEDVIADDHYRTVARIRAGNGYSADLHVVHLTSQGTAWIDSYDLVKANLSQAGGEANGVLSDSVIQEVDVRTGLVMWEWHAYGHIPFSESHNPAPAGTYPWDFAHLNSVDPGPSGDALVSVRNTWSLDDINLATGQIDWRVGGRNSSFRVEPNATFYWQHDAAWQPGGLISLFDNGSDPPEEPESRGLVIALDRAHHTARLVSQFANPKRTLLASSQGSAQRLAGGGWLLGYGGLPDFTEFDASGRVVLDGTLGPGVQSFRAVLAPWHAVAPGRPALALEPAARALAVSWNGATEVASWRLLLGSGAASLQPAQTVARTGFETAIPLPAGARAGHAAVEALDAAGRVLGTSATISF
jgi:Arylsulfotransferase (ASST)